MVMRDIPQILAIFHKDRAADRSPRFQGYNPQQTTLHHLALAISLEDFAAEKQRIQTMGVPVRTAEHAWVQWRSFYFEDPEGNTVEFVCYDERVQ